MKNQDNKKEEVSRSLSKMAWRRLKRNKIAMFGLTMIIVSCLISILGALIRPDKTENADIEIPAIRTKNPGFTCNFLLMRKDEVEDNTPFYKMMFFGGRKENYHPLPITQFEFTETKIIITEYSGDDEEAKRTA